MKTIVATLFAFLMFGVFSASAEAQTSATALVVRQDSTGTITIQQVTTPQNPNIGITYTSFSTNDPTQGCQEFFWCFIEQTLVPKPFQLPLQGQMMVIVTSNGGLGQGINILPNDPSLTGPYVAFTSSLTTAENAIRDKLYSGL